MNQNAALDKWMDVNHFKNLMRLSFGAAERAAWKAGWKAGTRYTLAFVVEELRKQNKGDYAEFVMMLEP